MINFGLFFNRVLGIGNIFFTGHDSENATFSADITKVPVEYGANVVDNIVIQPIEITFNAFVSELPAYSFSFEGLFNAYKATSDAIDVLKTLMVSRQVVDVNCNLGYFPGMAVKEIKPLSDMDNITTIPLQITMAQINFVGSNGAQDPFESQYKDIINRGALQLAESLEEYLV